VRRDKATTNVVEVGRDKEKTMRRKRKTEKGGSNTWGSKEVGCVICVYRNEKVEEKAWARCYVGERRVAQETTRKGSTAKCKKVRRNGKYACRLVLGFCSSSPSLSSYGRVLGERDANLLYIWNPMYFYVISFSVYHL
jgi:hypothetical protein